MVMHVYLACSSSSSNSCPLPTGSPHAGFLTQASSKQTQDDDAQRLEPLYELSEALEDGLASLPSVNHSDPTVLLTSSSGSCSGGSSDATIARVNSVPSSSYSVVPNSDYLSHGSSSCYGPRSATTTSGGGVKLVVSSNNNPKLISPEPPAQFQLNTCMTTRSANCSPLPYVTSQLPRVRSLPTTSNGNNSATSNSAIRVAYPAGSTVYKGKTIVTPHGHILINADTNIYSKPVVKCTPTSNLQYNLVTSNNRSCGAIPNKTCGTGRITIQHYQTANHNTNSNVNTTMKPNGSLITGNTGTFPLIVGISGAITNCNTTSNISDSLGHTVATTTASNCTGNNAGVAVRNYRAKIAKKPYGVGVLKVVRSDSITRPIEMFDRLVNKVSPNSNYPLVDPIRPTASVDKILPSVKVSTPCGLPASSYDSSSNSLASTNNLSTLCSQLFNDDGGLSSLYFGDEIDKVLNSDEILSSLASDPSPMSIKTELEEVSDINGAGDVNNTSQRTVLKSDEISVKLEPFDPPLLPQQFHFPSTSQRATLEFDDIKVEPEHFEAAYLPEQFCLPETGVSCSSSISTTSPSTSTYVTTVRRPCADGVIGGSTRDETDEMDVDKDDDDDAAMFVLDGLGSSNMEDIPLRPEFLFNVSDIDEYDFFMF